MKTKIASLDRKVFRLIQKVSRLADEKQVPAFIVGGIVRDILLKKKIEDIDFVLEGDAIAFAKSFARKYGGQCRGFNEFSTAKVYFAKNHHVDFATTRKETYAHTGALPRVSHGSLKEDIIRRDFSINALAVSINKINFGLTEDLYGGLKDLKNKRIRVLHSKSFIDDPTRILRAVRFEQRLGFKIENKTLALLKSALKRGVDKTVKPQRYFREFKKILEEPQALKCIQRLYALGGLGFLHVKQLRVSRVKQIIKTKNWFLLFLAIVHDVPAKKLSELGKSLHLSQDQRKIIAFLPSISALEKFLKQKRLDNSAIYGLLDDLPQELVCYIQCISSSALVRRRINRYLNQMRRVKLKISGRDVKALGRMHHERIGKIVKEVLKAKLDNIVKTKSDELRYAKTLLVKG